MLLQQLLGFIGKLFGLLNAFAERFLRLLDFFELFSDLSATLSPPQFNRRSHREVSNFVG